jgi:CMP-N-acetylneuraminic acid synthetase
MKNIEDVAILIQARLSSQRCPKKMIRSFAGTTLTDLSIEKLLASKIIPKKNIYLAVHEPELIAIGEKHGVNVFVRSKESSMAEGESMSVLYEWWNKIPFKHIIMVNACAPMLKIETIDNFIQTYINTESNGLFGVIEKKNYFWDKEGNCFTPLTEAVMNTKTADIVYEAAHCLYASELNLIGKGLWMGDFQKPGDIELFPMNEDEVFDIDYEWEFNTYEALYSYLKKQG